MARMIHIRPSGAVLRRLRRLNAHKRPRSLPPLVVEGVTIPDHVVDSGHAAAYACEQLREVDPDVPRCRCGRVRQFYHESCDRCGATKPWLFQVELWPHRPPGFGDLVA